MERTPVRRSRDFKKTLGLALALAAIVAAPTAHADPNLEILDLHTRSDTLIVRFDVREGCFGKIIETIERGLSATVKYTIEIWEPRTSWFDKLVHTHVVTYKIRYDSWSEEYVAFGPQGELDAKPTPGDLSVVQAGINEAPVARVGQLDGDRSYYINLNVQIQPLTVDEVRELEVWLRGAWGGSESTTASRTKGISKGLFDLVKSLTGLGDQVIDARSEKFSLGELESRAWVPAPESGQDIPDFIRTLPIYDPKLIRFLGGLAAGNHEVESNAP